MSPRLPPAVLVLALAAAACSPAIQPVATTGPTATSPGATPGTVVPSARASFGPAGSGASEDPATPLTIDSELLAFLPAQVGGVDVTEDLDEAAKALGDPVLPDVASEVDAAVAVDSGSGNLVYALVVRLRPGALGDGAFRQWRDTYDVGACSDVGSTVQGHAETEIGGRTVYIGTCESGLRTYHARIDQAGLLVTAWSLGEGRFGEALMAGLRIPS